MRGFKRGASADTLARGHALIRNLRGGFSALTEAVPPNLRLATAWPLLAQAIWDPRRRGHRQPSDLRPRFAIPPACNGTPGGGAGPDAPDAPDDDWEAC